MPCRLDPTKSKVNYNGDIDRLSGKPLDNIHLSAGCNSLATRSSSLAEPAPRDTW